MSLFAGLRRAVRDAAHGLKRARETQLHDPQADLRLLSFAGEAALERWSLQTDQSVGGFSESSLVPHGERSALWSGRTELSADPSRQKAVLNPQRREASKTGFCGIRTAVGDEWRTGAFGMGEDLHDYHGLCVRMRPDARAYIINLRTDSMIDLDRTEDLYQAVLRPQPLAQHEAYAKGVLGTEASPRAPVMGMPARPVVAPPLELPESAGSGASGDAGAAGVAGAAAANEMLDIRVPWGAFLLTYRGYIQSSTPPPMHLNNISHVGFLLADGRHGPFELELESISAFRYDEDDYHTDEATRRGLDLNTAAGYTDIMGS